MPAQARYSDLATLKEELRAEVRAELIAELSGGNGAIRTKGKPGPKPKAGKPGPKPKAAPSAPKGPVAVKEGGRRGQDEIDLTKRGIVRFLRSNPGSRVDQIAAEFDGVQVKDLQLPIAQLLEAKAISRKGVKRGTTYSVK